MSKDRSPKGGDAPDRSDELLDTSIEQARTADLDQLGDALPKLRRGPLRKIWHFIKAFLRLLIDPRSLPLAKLVVLGALVYVVNPVDAVPDFIPVVGLLDDAGVVLAGLRALIKLGVNMKEYMDEDDPLDGLDDIRDAERT